MTLLHLLRSFARGASYLWIRSLPVGRARHVDPAAVAASIEILCEDAVNAQVRRHGGQLTQLTSEEVHKIQSQLLDDIVATLNFIFYGADVAA